MSDGPIPQSNNVLKNGVSLRRAAKLAGKRHGFVRRLIDAGYLPAYRDGGSDSAPRLKVLPADLDRAIERATRYYPPAARGLKMGRLAGARRLTRECISVRTRT